MALFGKSSGSAFGRLWDAQGLSGLFLAWILNPQASHGGNWYLWSDKSTNATDPFIVICNQPSPTRNSKAKFIKWTVTTSPINQIRLDYYLWFEPSTGTALVNYHRAFLGTTDSSFAYYFRGGPEVIFLITQVATTVYRTMISDFEGIWDGVYDLLEPETASGVATNQAFFEIDPNGRMSGFNGITGYKPNLDANGKLYFSIAFPSSIWQINIYKDAARTQLIGHTVNTSNNAAGLRTITQDNSSGLGGTINGDIPLAISADVECRFLRIDLQTGQGANFTVGNNYFISDLFTFAGANYFKVENIIGDQLVIDFLTNNFSTGAIIGAYPHRFYCDSNRGGNTADIASASAIATFPYHANQGLETSSTPSTNTIAFDYMQTVMPRLNPNPRGRYAMMREWLGENSPNPTNGIRRFYGRSKYTYITSPGGLAVLQFKRTLNAKDYICFELSAGSFGRVVLDTESPS